MPRVDASTPRHSAGSQAARTCLRRSSIGSDASASVPKKRKRIKFRVLVQAQMHFTRIHKKYKRMDSDHSGEEERAAVDVTDGGGGGARKKIRNTAASPIEGVRLKNYAARQGGISQARYDTILQLSSRAIYLTFLLYSENTYYVYIGVNHIALRLYS